MLLMLLRWAVLGGAALSFLYYLFALYCARSFFLERRDSEVEFNPPVSVLKPACGLDRDAYANFASFCQQDYHDYEVLFAVSDASDPVIPIIRKLIQDFPERSIRLLIGWKQPGSNDKVSKLCRLAQEARHEILVISDSDVRVAPDYLRAVAAPFRDGRLGAVTCMYLGVVDHNLSAQFEAVGLTSAFLASVIVARRVEGVNFALGATMATTRLRLSEIGGFEAIADCFSDDFELGKRIAAKGYRVELLPYAVGLVLPFQTLLDLFKRQLRWAVGMRHARPWGYFGLVLTQGLPWSLAAVALHPSARLAAILLGAYLALRLSLAWTVGVWGLKDSVMRRNWWLVPLWDVAAFLIWLASFTRNRLRWRGSEFYIHKGRLIPIASRSGGK